MASGGFRRTAMAKFTGQLLKSIFPGCGTDPLSRLSVLFTPQQYVDLADGGNDADGTRVQLWTNTGGDNQKWEAHEPVYAQVGVVCLGTSTSICTSTRTSVHELMIRNLRNYSCYYNSNTNNASQQRQVNYRDRLGVESIITTVDY
jgi:hypothetical protein